VMADDAIFFGTQGLDRALGGADLDAVNRRDEIVIARAADDRAARQLPDRPRQPVPVRLTRERVGDGGACLPGGRHRREPQLSEPAVGRGGREAVVMRLRERL
jgi:hypothetical protein